MIAAFKNLVASSLPSEERLRTRLAGLSAQDWAGLAQAFAASLPEFDAVVPLHGATELARELAQARGVSVLGPSPEPGAAPQAPSGGEVVLVTDHLTGGSEELEAAELAARRGLRAVAVAAAVERTSAGGRRLLELQGVRVYTALQLADTPGGLVFERRAPQRWRTAG